MLAIAEGLLQFWDGERASSASFFELPFRQLVAVPPRGILVANMHLDFVVIKILIFYWKIKKSYCCTLFLSFNTTIQVEISQTFHRLCPNWPRKRIKRTLSVGSQYSKKNWLLWRAAMVKRTHSCVLSWNAVSLLLTDIIMIYAENVCIFVNFLKTFCQIEDL